VTTFKDRLAAREPMFGMWVASGSTVNAEICAGSGLDFLLLDGEHSPNDLPSLLAQLQAIAAYPIQAVVRPPIGDVVLIKQYLDIGATALLVPMVTSAEQAERLVAAVRYPPRGIRGVGSALARSARWGRDAGYLDGADDGITLLVQVESAEALDAIEQIAAVDGVDGIFVGPSDLAASLGHLGHPEHPDVVARVEDAIQRIVAAGTPAGVNAFVEATARRCVELGASFVLVGADVTMLTRESGRLAATYVRKD
jgi:4-hydroxy-2-oxoheptanedioate aldolase